MQDKYNITLIRSRIKTKPYAKTDGLYSGRTWNNDIGLQTISNTLSDTFNLLQVLQGKSDTCMVTGTAVKPQIINTDRTLKNFKEEPIHMLVLDLDNYESDVIATSSSLHYDQVTQETDKFIEEYLPPEFQDVTYIVRFSSSFLFKSKTQLRCHIIFILEEPQYPREIGMWIKHDKIPVDATFYFNLTQPIFTAAPLWRSGVDPLSLLDKPFPRIGMVLKQHSHVSHGWQPYHIKRYKNPIDISKLPAASALPGKIGSFCRMIDARKILASLGYVLESENRYLAPSSQTGVPGAIVFDNGYVFSHHEGDPVNQIVEKIFNFRRRSLNAYDLMYGWAKVNQKTDPSVFDEFEFLLNQAIINDTEYQNEVQQELVSRTDWLIEGGYEGSNRMIVDSIMTDMQSLGMSEVMRDYIYNIIILKTKHIRLQVLRNMYKNIRRDQALHKDSFDPEATLRNMAKIFKRQKVLYAHHKTLAGNFWCYFSKERLWKLCNKAQTEAFIYNHIHATIPLKMEVDYFKVERLIRNIMRESCLAIKDFKKGAGWAFKGGRYGILMDKLFSDSHQWQSDKSIRTLKKTDNIYKELPITYKEWKESKNTPPNTYIDFLVSSCEEDISSVELIREFGGYVLADAYPLHKMLILEGVPGSGKSILAKVLQQCLGRQYHSAVSIKGLVNRFGLGNLPGKKLVVMSEAREIDFNTLTAIIPILLKIVGRDYIDTEAKHQSSLTELLECKVLLLTNRMVVMPDDTGALAQRIMMVRFNKCFRGTKDEVLGLDEKITNEGLASIIRWHLIGLEQLSKRKDFIEPKSGVAAKKLLIEQIDPLKTFIETYFKIDNHTLHEYWVIQKDFNLCFRAYLKRIGQSSDGSKVRRRASIRNIQSLFPHVSKARKKGGDNYVWKLKGLNPITILNVEFVEELSVLDDEDSYA